jgi:hypothetical protein
MPFAAVDMPSNFHGLLETGSAASPARIESATRNMAASPSTDKKIHG